MNCYKIIKILLDQLIYCYILDCCENNGLVHSKLASLLIKNKEYLSFPGRVVILFLGLDHGYLYELGSLTARDLKFIR